VDKLFRSLWVYLHSTEWHRLYATYHIYTRVLQCSNGVGCAKFKWNKGDNLEKCEIPQNIVLSKSEESKLTCNMLHVEEAYLMSHYNVTMCGHMIMTYFQCLSSVVSQLRVCSHGSMCEWMIRTLVYIRYYLSDAAFVRGSFFHLL
jgi:hypothetical protein